MGIDKEKRSTGFAAGDRKGQEETGNTFFQTQAGKKEKE